MVIVSLHETYEGVDADDDWRLKLAITERRSRPARRQDRICHSFRQAQRARIPKVAFARRLTSRKNSHLQPMIPPYQYNTR
jgi:hypothetical protein